MNLSLEEFAFQSRISWQMICDYERGKNHPGTKNAPKLAQFLEIEESHLWEQISKSIAYLKEHGEDGIKRLISMQPAAHSHAKAVHSVFDGSAKAYEYLREKGEPTIPVKVSLPLSYEAVVRRASRVLDGGTDMSGMLGRKICELIDAGWLSEFKEGEDGKA